MKGLLIVLLLAQGAGKGPEPVAAQEPLRLPGGWIDYAPAGVPDFSQCRAEWSRAAATPGAPAQWTHAGPVALANVLWWLDSRAEPEPRPPTSAADGHPLVTSYPVFGRAPDDHDAANVGPLVEELAARAGTNGVGRTNRLRGTEWMELTAAARSYVERRRLSDLYPLQSKLRPDGAWLSQRIAEEAGVVLLLGMWERQEEGWRRVGGHYVALAGASADGSQVSVADPLLDSAGAGGAGVALPADATRHSCREAPAEHDDAGVISHDSYALYPPPDLPEGGLALAGFFTPATAHNAAAFAGQNDAGHLMEHAGLWRGGTPVMAIDAAFALVPPLAGGRGPVGGPTATSPATTPVPTTPPPSATAIDTPTAGAPAATATRPLALPSLPTVAPTATSALSGLRPVRPVGLLWLPLAVDELR
jgi:hypothetical protein